MSRGITPQADPVPVEPLLVDDALLRRARITLPPRREDPAYGPWAEEHERWWTPARHQLADRLQELLADGGGGLTHPQLTTL